MKRENKIRKYVSMILLSCLLCFQCGCFSGGEMRDIAGKVNTVGEHIKVVAGAIEEASEDTNDVITILKTIAAGNTASAPFNPYALPIGAGLSGIIALLEALRRKEQAGRKYAEQKLNNGSSANGK